MNTLNLKLSPKTIRFLIRACELSSGLQHDDPNDQWLYADLATELAEMYEAEQERLEGHHQKDLDMDALDIATDRLEAAGQMYLWFNTKLPWRELDPIGKEEFRAVAADIIRNYLRKTNQRSVLPETHWRGGVKSARFASVALRDWLDTKLLEWEDLDDLPNGWDWNDVPLFEYAIHELERLGHY